MKMEYNKQICMAMTFLGALLVVAFSEIHIDSNAYAQALLNSSSATSTVCVDNQPCLTMICNDNQPCHVSKSPNIESPYEDNLDEYEDNLDEDDIFDYD
jgi:hypothetical protein